MNAGPAQHTQDPNVATSVEALFKSVDAWQTGHFLLSSGLHSDQYMQCQRILQYPVHGMHLARALATKMLAAGIKPKAVVGPALGAVHLEVFMALAFNEILNSSAPTTTKATTSEHHNSQDQVRAIFAERAENGKDFVIRRGIELAQGEEVIVVEDVTTTGGSAKRVVDLLTAMGAKTLAVGTIIDRSGGLAKFDQPFFALEQLNLKTYEADACPMCQAGSQPIKPGSSKK
ncbi:orotate phosphoribosyltransferase [bacterium]|jgi:orotate phosphoribosyltransferase|nr:orotate phosphoribosyltransferase [bacterium]